MMAIINTIPTIAAKIEPTMIDVMFLLVTELFENTVGDGVSKELVGVELADSRLGPDKISDIEPADGLKPAPDS